MRFSKSEENDQLKNATVTAVPILPNQLDKAAVKFVVNVHQYFVEIDQLEIQLPPDSGGKTTYYNISGVHWPAGWWNGLPMADDLVAEVILNTVL